MYKNCAVFVIETPLSAECYTITTEYLLIKNYTFDLKI